MYWIPFALHVLIASGVISRDRVAIGMFREIVGSELPLCARRWSHVRTVAIMDGAKCVGVLWPKRAAYSHRLGGPVEI